MSNTGNIISEPADVKKKKELAGGGRRRGTQTLPEPKRWDRNNKSARLLVYC